VVGLVVGEVVATATVVAGAVVAVGRVVGGIVAAVVLVRQITPQPDVVGGAVEVGAAAPAPPAWPTITERASAADSEISAALSTASAPRRTIATVSQPSRGPRTACGLLFGPFSKNVTAIPGRARRL
jgi:hypothetical protein